MISMPSTWTNAPLTIRAMFHFRRQGSVQTVEMRKRKINESLLAALDSLPIEAL